MNALPASARQHPAREDGSLSTPDAAADVRCIAVVGASTAGHVYPALAVADALREDTGLRLLFVGSRGGFEERLVPDGGFELALICAAPFMRASFGGRAQALVSLGRGFLQARALLRQHKVALVLGFGGFVSASVVLAARSLRIPTVIHEANRVPGRANRLLARVADRVHLSFPDTAHAFPPARTAVTGQPVRQGIAALSASTASRVAPDPRCLHILVTGGSNGSPFLNARAPELVAALAQRGVGVQVHHQVGDDPPEPVQAAYDSVGIPARVETFIEDMAAAYRRADLAVACAGAGTLAELAMTGLPALLVPLARAADDHQSANARWMERRGAAWMVREADWDPIALAAVLHTGLMDPDQWRTRVAALRRLAAPQAVDEIVMDCRRLLGVCRT